MGEKRTNKNTEHIENQLDALIGCEPAGIIYMRIHKNK